MDEGTFNDGDEIVLYGAIIPNHKTNQHKMSVIYIGDINIIGTLDDLKNRNGNDLYHIYAVKLKVSVTKVFLTKKRKYSILEYKEIDA